MFKVLKRLKIYTKTGDKGSTSLFTGERRSKDDAVFQSLGNTDELNSFIGLAAVQCKNHQDISNMLEFIQSRLLDVGSNIATPKSSNHEKLARVGFKAEYVDNLEKWIDQMDKDLPPLKNFILPSGGEGSARLHVARSVCRRAERSIVKQFLDGEVDESAYKFINRLSDFLFVAARTVAHRENIQETIWKKE
ncbi:hypothetical protein SteCoe_22391 [Stentor coeruleus]|uniref:Corrinoid adenosyltransferase MMAB n=1 Tax=Stentor coeruleus TaxID=5963 RepID=A0A1R2BMD2_9CILI|nr:hypothetical protein SteCoe_22391 [Stentor coeruleus]